MPNWALAPDSGKITPTLISDGAASARPGKLAASAAAPNPATNSLRPGRMACWGFVMSVSWLFRVRRKAAGPALCGTLLCSNFKQSRRLSDNLTIDDVWIID
ncbi:hypothetical protein GCM10008164_25480 [Achromobacter xylosoxidans]|nr:hypothetical protein GCM10008164_25480 [Achromobacter xylosoxidans]